MRAETKQGAGRSASGWENDRSQVGKVLHTDTLLTAVQRMRQLGCALVRVVDGGGQTLGLVTEREVMRAWQRDPLVAVSEVMVPGTPGLGDGHALS